MGRRKLEIKRIEDKSSRLVAFSKRRTGLIKKARQLSVLCDVDVAVVVFSAGGKLYEFCSGGNNRVDQNLARYQKSCHEAESEGSTSKRDGQDLHIKFRTCKELLQTVDRLVEDTNSEKISVTDMTQLEEELNDALVQTRSRKLKMDYVSTLQQQERELNKEKEEIQKQITSVCEGDDGGGGLNDIVTNHMDLPQHLTLPLFNS